MTVAVKKTTSLEQHAFSLNDRYSLEQGQVLLTGIQALVRLPMDQMRRDRSRSLNTGAFISGYRGSPLGGYDLQLSRVKPLLDKWNIKFQPGVNEELGATAVWGSQQVNLFDGATVDGVCGLWYGKTPGVDRSTDAFRHGNAAGSSKLGGVLVVAGDDHGCKSSSYPGQSEFAFVDMHMPVLNPADVQEVLDYGLYGFELSRFSGCWVAMIALAENMDSAATVNIDPQRITIQYPGDLAMPEGGLNIRLNDSPFEQEERLWRYKRPAALAFCRKNKLNKTIWPNPEGKLGIITAGKAHLDLMEALSQLDIDQQKARAIGIRIYKVGMTYPLDVEGIRDFARGLDTLLVVEEKRSLIEVQLKEELYNIEVVDPHFPNIIGKTDSHDNPLLPVYGELSPSIVADVLLKILPDSFSGQTLQERQLAVSTTCPQASAMKITTKRIPFFCSGCPHNTSTKVPEGSRALAGIGCHYLVQNMDRNTFTFTQMGGEGVNWIGQSHFTETSHVFVNLGDGTYFHSGLLAIRAAVAAKVNVTYKILYNDAVAMTGGQPHDGELLPNAIAAQVLAEGINCLAVVTDETKKYDGKLVFPRDIKFYHRDRLDDVQREFREVKGVTVIIYDQTCATELRRKRKRGLIEDPNRRVIINDLVCEGCGDCSVQSNCISIEPMSTPFGVKRQINQTTCNKDLSCVKGFCPSFVTVVGGQLRKPGRQQVDYIDMAATLPAPVVTDLTRPWSILVTGVGGTGVVTVGALMSMAAHLEGKAVTTLDQTGLAQKGGAVYSHIRIADHAEQLHAVRIAQASADVLIACDLAAAGDFENCLDKLAGRRTKTVVNTDMLPTAAFVLGRENADDKQQIIDTLEEYSAELHCPDAYQITQRIFGATVTANVFMLGYAWQRGYVPLSLARLLEAITLNGTAVEDNQQAFAAGRLAAVGHKLSSPPEAAAIETKDDLHEMVEYRATFLTGYQNAAYAMQYRELVERVARREQEITKEQTLSKAVARYGFKLMAYKDEYEVARLYSGENFQRQLQETFTGSYQLRFNLAPPVISRPDRQTGIARKRVFGGWMRYVFKVLAACKGLRGTPFDPFGYLAERKQERALIERYNKTVTMLLEHLTPENYNDACRIASLPDQIRGYGHIKAKSIAVIDKQWTVLLGRYKG